MRFLNFALSGELFGIPMSAVQELELNLKHTRIEGAPPEVAGLATRRGQLATLLNLNHILSLAPMGNCAKARSVMIDVSNVDPEGKYGLSPSATGQVGFLVDSIFGVSTEISAQSVKPLHRQTHRFISEAVDYEKSVLQIIDVGQILAHCLGKG